MNGKLSFLFLQSNTEWLSNNLSALDTRVERFFTYLKSCKHSVEKLLKGVKIIP